MATLPTALGVDIGGTSIRVAVVAADHRILAACDAATPPEGDPRALAATLTELTARVRAEHAPTAPRAGVALPGIWDRHTGIMQRAVNLPRLEGIKVQTLLMDALGGPVHVEIDVNAAGWAQWHALTPRPARLVYVSIGTGVGGCAVLEGQLVRHTRGGAGHFGFLIVDTREDASAGPNGLRGCLSAVVSGAALNQVPASEPLAQRVNRGAGALAIGLLQLAHIYVPDVLLLGGGVIDNHPALLDQTRAHFATFHSSVLPANLAIRRAPLATKDAGVIGSALLALSNGPS